MPLALTYGLFHLRESLLPGLGAPLLILGLLGFAAPLIAPPTRRAPLLVIAAFAVLWIAAHEISPFKSYPGFHRYMVPVAPLLVILGTAFVYEPGATALAAMERRGRVHRHSAGGLARAPCLLSHRRRAGGATFERYARLGVKGGQMTAHGRAPLKPTALLVTSNLAYARYGALATADLQDHEIRGRAARYAELFRRPYLEVSNGRSTFAFFNPVLRIVALDGDATHLERLAAALRGEYPGLRLTLVNAGG